MKALQFNDDYNDALNQAGDDGEEITLDTDVRLLIDGKIFYVTGISIGHDENTSDGVDAEDWPVVLIEGSSNPGY
jgi:hypothetical protein